MDFKQKIKKPIMSNFLTLEPVGFGRKQDGWQEAPKIPVQSLTLEQAEEYAELMKTSFIEHYKRLKEQPIER